MLPPPGRQASLETRPRGAPGGPGVLRGGTPLRLVKTPFIKMGILTNFGRKILTSESVRHHTAKDERCSCRQGVLPALRARLDRREAVRYCEEERKRRVERKEQQKSAEILLSRLSFVFCLRVFFPI